MFKLHTPTGCKSYLDIYYKFKHIREVHISQGWTCQAMSWLGSNPCGNHPVLWPQLAPWQTPTLRNPQEVLAPYPLKNRQQRAPFILLLWNKFPCSQAVEESVCHSNKHQEPYYSFYKIAVLQDEITISYKSGSLDLRSHSNSTFKPISNGEHKQRGTRRWGTD